MTDETPNVVGSAISGVSGLVALQLISRFFTFFLNVLIARHIGPQAFGVNAVQFHLFLSTVLFLSREGIRRACLRVAIRKGDDPQQNRGSVLLAHVVNAAWISVPVCATLSVGAFYFVTQETGQAADADFTHAVRVYAVACTAEMLSEPLFILYSNQLLVSPRVRIEVLAVTLRCALTYVLLLVATRAPSDPGVEVEAVGGLSAFGYGQLAYAVTLCVGYYAHAAWCVRDTVAGGAGFVLPRLASAFPTKGQGGHYFDGALLRSVAVYSVHSLEKYVLTHGESIVLVVYQTATEQGVYGLVNNLGSLVARFIFQPLEEQSYILFGKLHANGRNALAGRLLALLLKTVGTLGLVFVAFGPNYSFALLDLLYGRGWSHTAAPTVLAWYCVYVLFISVNGVTEAFVHSVASNADLWYFNKLLILFSAFYLGAAVVCLQSMGTTGLITANCLNMAVRIALSGSYIRRFLKESGCQVPARSVLPHPATLLSFAVAFFVTYASCEHFCPSVDEMGAVCGRREQFLHIGVGAACLVSVLATMYKVDRVFLRQLRNVRRMGDESGSGNEGEESKDLGKSTAKKGVRARPTEKGGVKEE